MKRTALKYYLTQRRESNDISDEEMSVYSLGFRDALSAILSDKTYYGALDAKTSKYSAVQDAVTFVKTQPFDEPKD